MLGYMILAAGKQVLFYRFIQFGLLWPILEIPLVGLTYTTYKACSSLTSTNFQGTTDTSQYSSCTGGSSAEYGDSGSIAVKVNDDPRTLWFIINALSVALHTGLTYYAFPAFTNYYGPMTIGDAPPVENENVRDSEWAYEERYGTPEEAAAFDAPPPAQNGTANGTEPAGQPKNEGGWGGSGADWNSNGGWNML